MYRHGKNRTVGRKTTISDRRQKEIDTGWYIAGWCILALFGGYLLISHVTGFRIESVLYPCLFHSATGLYCPGCGGTRAFQALLRGDLMGVLRYQPFFVYVLIAGGWFMFSQTIERLSRGKIKIGLHYRDAYLWIGLAILLISWLVKNAALLIWGFDL